MNEEILQRGQQALEERSRSLFHASVENLDMPTLSRLNQARQAALAEVASGTRRPWLLRMPVLTSAGGFAAAAVLGVALWFGNPSGHVTPAESTFEDLDLVAATDEGAGDAVEMLQDDVDFYDWADKVSGSEPAA
jgi:negative regulator of sigma E activity